MSVAIQRSLWWAGAIGVALVILLTRLQLSFDLSAFFPRHTTLAHEVLIEQVRNGPASRLLVVGIGLRPDDENRHGLLQGGRFRIADEALQVFVIGYDVVVVDRSVDVTQAEMDGLRALRILG